MKNELDHIINKLESAKIIEVLNSNRNAASIFNKYGIEYYRVPEMKLEDAARMAKIPLNDIIRELNLILKKENDKQNLYDLDPVDLSKWIVEVHHSFTKESLREIINYSHEYLHEELNDEFKNLQTQLTGLATELFSHMEREEKILFPLIKYLVDTDKFKERPKTRNYGTVRNPVQQMLKEHDSSISLLRTIESSIENLPGGKKTDNIKEQLLKKITGLRCDLYFHIHLENNLLFPRIIQLENKLLNKS